jgi:hypothetical protein
MPGTAPGCAWPHGWLMKGRICGFDILHGYFVFLIFSMAQPHGQMMSI